MTIPGYQALMLPVLQLLTESGAISVREVKRRMTEKLNLSDEERYATIPSGRETYIKSRIHWALFYLFRAGLLQRPRRGYYTITARGREALAAEPEFIDNKFLLQYPEFQEFASRRPRDTPRQEAAQITSGSQEIEAQTPEERIDNAYRERLNMLHDEVLQRLLDVPPQFFEKVVIKLLVAMGFGGSLEDAGKHMGGSHDGGIDGIIKEDKLGLDKIYVQAKRFAPDRTVGRPDLQRFVGSLTGESAHKGVFLTTSSFSIEAQEYVRKIDKSLVLIDGEELARLMVEHDVGMRTSRTIKIKEIDESFFQDED